MTKEISIMSAGDIELSDTVIVSDPCYRRDTWCNAKDVAVKPGKYATYIVNKDEREGGISIPSLIVVHTDFVKSLKNNWEPYDCTIGIDSGLCGIFDDAAYPDYGYTTGDYDDRDSLFGECCALTPNRPYGGILRDRNGVVSSSGHCGGDSVLLCQYHAGERIALMVDFGLEQIDVIMGALIEHLGL